jgi:hypothetical protein
MWELRFTARDFFDSRHLNTNHIQKRYGYQPASSNRTSQALRVCNQKSKNNSSSSRPDNITVAVWLALHRHYPSRKYANI